MGFKKAKHRATGVPGQVRCFFLRYYRNPNIYGSSIANAGQIQAGNDSAILLIGSGATFNLTGAGTVSLGAENTVLEGYFGNENLVNQGNTIQGQGSIQFLASFQNQGTVNANVSGGTLAINSINNVTNTGTLEATGGGTLFINSSTVNNAGGTIFAGSSSTATLYGATINGGNLSSASGGVIQGLFTDTLNGVTITSGTTYFLNNSVTYLTGDLTNKGTVVVGNSSQSSGLLVQGTVANNGTINLTGGGTINLNNAGSVLEGFNGNETLVNHDNLIQGQGSIQFLGSFQNGGTVNANVSGGTLSIENAPTTNNGTFQVGSGSSLVVNGAFTTAGTVSIGELHSPSGSLFQMVGANNFVQTNGTTTLWASGSTLGVASGQAVNIEGGLLQGFGTIQGNLINAGTVHPGDGPGLLTVNGNYSQNSGGILDIQIGGSAPGTGYSVLSVTGLATLESGSVLDVSLFGGFKPTLDETFVILTSGGLSGTFIDNTIIDGNVTFTVSYSPQGYLNDVVLNSQMVSSVPEPASLLMLGLGIVGMATYASWSRRKTNGN
jgi:PEP-CTERM motif